MTQEEQSEFKKNIELLITELKESDAYLVDASKPVEPSVALGRLTRMEAINDKSVMEALSTNTKRRLERLANALDRIEKGTYGTCLRCGCEIPFGRLKILPESLFCVACEAKKTR